MTAPIIHDNGTPRAALSAGYEAAYDALHAAADAMKRTAPNPRDYPPGALERACAEHDGRLSRVATLMAEFDALVGHCDGVTR